MQISPIAPRVMLTILIGALVACGVADQGTEARSSTATTDVQETVRDTAMHLAQLGKAMYALEDEAVAFAFGDASGETEGEEQLYHTLYSSSIAVLSVAVSRDSANAVGWYWLGRALAAKAYRGFGEWELDEQTRAVQALKRAQSLLHRNDELWQVVEEALARERGTLEALRR